jgi:hypothetical protein
MLAHWGVRHWESKLIKKRILCKSPKNIGNTFYTTPRGSPGSNLKLNPDIWLVPSRQILSLPHLIYQNLGTFKPPSNSHLIPHSAYKIIFMVPNFVLHSSKNTHPDLKRLKTPRYQKSPRYLISRIVARDGPITHSHLPPKIRFAVRLLAGSDREWRNQSNRESYMRMIWW